MPQGRTTTHPPVENHGKLGTWYWRSPGANVPVDDDDDQKVPTLETKGDAYLPRNVSKSSPPAFVHYSGIASVQVNVDAQGHNIVGDAANEPTLAVDPTNHNHIVIGWRQFDNVSSNFRQAGNAYSMNGGLGWTNRPVFTPGTFRSDPVLVPDSTGNFFYNSLKQTFFTDVFTSSNSGIDYQLKGPAMGGDKQWMTCDQTQGSGRGFLYESWSTSGNNYGGRQFSRSVNGGASWMDPINIPGSPIWGTLDVARNGSLYLCGLAGGNFEFCRSTDAQNGSVTPTFDRVVTVNLGGAIVFGSSINPAGLMGQAWIATDKSTGPNSGNIYMLCSVGVNSNNPCQVNFVRSTDGGLTWSQPRTLNTDTPNVGASHWFGTMAVAPSGRIDVCWYDNRANPAISDSALFTTSSYDGGVTWTPNVQLTPSFNPNIGYPNQNKMGDYMGMVSDTQGSNIAYAATFNSEEDIWFLRVPDTISMPTNATSISTLQGTYLNGSVGDIWNADGNVYSIGPVAIRGEGSVTSAVTSYTLPVSDAGGLSLRVKATTTMPTVATIWFWNWQTQAWDQKGSTAWPSNTATDVTFPINSSIAPYIDSNNNVRCLVKFAYQKQRTLSRYVLRLDVVQLLFG